MKRNLLGSYLVREKHEYHIAKHEDVCIVMWLEIEKINGKKNWYEKFDGTRKKSSSPMCEFISL